MSAMALDKPLDDMIASNPTTRAGKPKGPRNDKRRNANGSGNKHKSAIVGNNNNAKQAVKRVASVGNNRSPSFDEMLPTAKIMVSNLPFDVTDEQVKDLFKSTIGPIKEVTLFFNSKGGPTGRASVVFRSEAHGKAAWKCYNGRLIDATKPMVVELIYESTIPGGALAARMSAPKRESKENQPQSNKNRTQNAGAPARNQKRVKRTPKTVEDLDAEMAEYASVPNN